MKNHHQKLQVLYAYVLIYLMLFILSINFSFATSLDYKTSSVSKLPHETIDATNNSYALVSGTTCYPSENIPAMTIYARNIKTKETFSIHLTENTSEYEIKIPVEGTYIFFSWTEGKNNLGAIYSYAVPCGLSIECTNHKPITVNIKLGDKITDVNICDYYGGAVPKP